MNWWRPASPHQSDNRLTMIDKHNCIHVAEAFAPFFPPNERVTTYNREVCSP